jgi:hypothetical protein
VTRDLERFEADGPALTNESRRRARWAALTGRGCPGYARGAAGRAAADPDARSTKPLETALDAMLALIAREAAA